MKRLLFLLGGVFLCGWTIAVGLIAAWLNSGLAASAAFSLFGALVCLAVTGAVCGQGVVRTLCVGFAVFSLGYYYAATRSPDSVFTDALIDRLPAFGFRPRVGDKVVAQWRGSSYYPATIGQVQNGMYYAVWDDGDVPLWVTYSQIQYNRSYQRSTAHCVVAIGVALLGAFVAAAVFGAGRFADKPDSSADKPATLESTPSEAPPA
ncbi:MAG: hypothetical protein HYS13_19920 [Planctomycetia bacterium]|nr:hypothetical protein [Planctomycetia bacterium]